MTGGIVPMPRWLVVLLACETGLAVLASVALTVVALAFMHVPTSLDVAVAALVIALPLLIAAGTFVLSRFLWRRAGGGAAVLAALLPVAFGVPFLLFLTGFGY